ncbi:MAG: hypothetical protein Q4P34_07325 [Tissierellia bacterium]|nr:hypothetical protein [Tissierellia bacterium]
MINLWTLIKKDFLLLFGFLLNPKAAFKNKKARKQMLLYPIIFAILALYTFLFIKLILGVTDYFIFMGLSEIFLSIGFISYIFMIIIFGIAPLISQLYFSKDIEILLRLPVSTNSIFAAKILSLSLNSLILMIVFILPMLIKFGRSTNQNPIFYLKSLIGIFAITLITMSLMTFLIVLIMRFINQFSNIKNILQTIGMFIIIFLSFGIQFILNNKNLGLNDLQEIVEKILSIIYRFFPYVKLLVMSILSDSLQMRIIYFVSLIVLSSIVFILVIKLGNKSLLKGILANKIITKRKYKNLDKSYKEKPVAIEIAKKDAIDIFKTPIYFFNIASTGLVLPLILLISNIANGVSIDMIMNFKLPFNLTFYDEIIFFIVAGFYLSFILTASGQSALTSITREGKNIWLMKSLPISAKDQINGRLICSYGFCLLSNAPTFILIVFILKPGFFSVLSYLIGLTISSVFTSGVGLLADTINPKLVWDNPHKAIKQNLNIFIVMVMILLYMAAQIFILYKLYFILKFEFLNIVFIGILLIHIFLAIYLRKINLRIFKKKLIEYSAE